MLARLTAARLGSRVAIAGTWGAAHALARFGPRPAMIAASGETGAAVAAVADRGAAARSARIVERLRKLGFETHRRPRGDAARAVDVAVRLRTRPPARPGVRPRRRADRAGPAGPNSSRSGAPSPSRSARRKPWRDTSAKLVEALCAELEARASAPGASICCSAGSTIGCRRSGSARPSRCATSSG